MRPLLFEGTPFIMSNLADVIISPAFETLQLCEFISENQYTGVGTGINAQVTGFFSSTLQASGANPAMTREFFGSLSGSVNGLLGYVSNNSPFRDLRNIDIEFMKYLPCTNSFHTVLISYGEIKNWYTVWPTS